jgi:hypothetical protein
MFGVPDVSDRWGRLLYFAAVPGFRFSEEFRVHRSPPVRLSGSGYVLGHLGVHGRPYVSTVVVSTALAMASAVPIGSSWTKALGWSPCMASHGGELQPCSRLAHF